MAKGVKFRIEYKSFFDDNCKIEILVEGYSGVIYDVKGAAEGLLIERNKTIQDTALNGLLDTKYTITGVTSAEYNAKAFGSEEYGDIVFKYYVNTIQKESGVITPFDTAQGYLPDGSTYLSLGAEIGFQQLKETTFTNTGGAFFSGRIKLIDAISKALQLLPVPNTYPIQSDINTLTYTDGVEVDTANGFFERYIDAEAFKNSSREWMNAYEVLSNIVADTYQLSFHSGKWSIINPIESLQADKYVTIYSFEGVRQSRTLTNVTTKALSAETILSGGQEGKRFSRKNITISHEVKSVANRMPNALFARTGFDINDWTNEDSFGSTQVGGDGTNSDPTYYQINGSYYSPTETGADSQYIQSTAFNWFPHGQSDFEDRTNIDFYSEDERLKFAIDAEYGTGISGGRLQIIATYDELKAGYNNNFFYESTTVYLTDEGWSKTPAFYATGTGQVEEVELPSTPIVRSVGLRFRSNTTDQYSRPTPPTVAVTLRIFRPSRKKIGESTIEENGFSYFAKYFAITASTWLQSQEDILAGDSKNEYVTSRKTDGNSIDEITYSIYDNVSPYAFGSIYPNGTTQVAINGYKRRGGVTITDFNVFLAKSFLRQNDSRLEYLTLPIIGEVDLLQIYSSGSTKFRIYDYRENTAKNTVEIGLIEIKYSNSAIELKTNERDFNEVVAQRPYSKYDYTGRNTPTVTDDNLKLEYGVLSLNSTIEDIYNINLEGQVATFGGAAKFLEGEVFLRADTNPNAGLIYTDENDAVTGYVKQVTGGTAIRAIDSTKHVVIDTSGLTQDVKLTVPNLAVNSVIATANGLTTNYLPKLGASGVLGNSIISEDDFRVGVGFANPVFTFDVRQVSPYTYNRASFGGMSPDGSSHGYMLIPPNGGGFFDVIRRNNTALRFATETSLGFGFSTQMTLTADGKLGVKTPNPTHDFQVNGTTRTNKLLVNTATDSGEVAQFNGTTRTTNLKINEGATVGRVWQCTNADGSGAWVSPLSNYQIDETSADGGVRNSFGLIFRDEEGSEVSRLVHDQTASWFGFETTARNSSDNVFKAQNIIDADGFWRRRLDGGEGNRYALLSDIVSSGGTVTPTLQAVTTQGLSTDKRIVFQESAGANYAFATVSDTVRLQHRANGGTAVNYALINEQLGNQKLQWNNTNGSYVNFEGGSGSMVGSSFEVGRTLSFAFDGATQFGITHPDTVMFTGSLLTAATNYLISKDSQFVNYSKLGSSFLSDQNIAIFAPDIKIGGGYNNVLASDSVKIKSNKIFLNDIEIDMSGFAVGKVLKATAASKAEWVTL
jgi:hypothetical protein